MIIRIRTKLIVSISLLILLLLSSSAVLLTREKRIELSEDFFNKNFAFSRLVSDQIAINYETFLKEDNFLFFNSEIQNVFTQNSDLKSIEVVSYLGDVLYNSHLDKEKRYSGPSRKISSELVLEQIRSKKVSFKEFFSSNVYYLELDSSQLKFYDYQDNDLAQPSKGFIASRFNVPVLDKYSIIFHYDTDVLDKRVNELVLKIAYLTAFGVLLGIILSFILARHFNYPLSKLMKATENLASGNYDSRVDIKTRDELSILGLAFNKMAADLKGSLDARVYKEKMGRELELAGQIQHQLIPKDLPNISGLDMSAFILPADEVGGDMYDFLPSIDNDHLFYLGDVTGHGIPAGLLSSISSALFYGFSKLSDLKEILVRVNEVFHAKTLSHMFMTLCLVRYNDFTNNLTYVSAGHEQIVRYSSKDNTTLLMPAGGVALGMTKEISKLLKEVSFVMEKDDFAVIYSDGIPETWNDKRKLYGMQRLLNIVKANSTLQTAKKMQDAILKDVKLFANGAKQMDDITIIVLRKI